MADKNALAIKVAQEVVEREFQLGQKLAELMFGIPGSQENAAVNDSVYCRDEHAEYESFVESERGAARTQVYLERHA